MYSICSAELCISGLPVYARDCMVSYTTYSALLIAYLSTVCHTGVSSYAPLSTLHVVLELSELCHDFNRLTFASCFPIPSAKSSMISSPV